MLSKHLSFAKTLSKHRRFYISPLHFWISIVHLIHRYKKYDILGIFGIVFLFVYIEKSNTISIYPIFLLMFFLEPFFSNVATGILNTLPRLIVGGRDMAYVIVMNNLVTLTITGTGVLFLELGMMLKSNEFLQHSVHRLTYFGVSIFPLTILANYTSILKPILGLKKQGSIADIVLSYLLHSILILLASIPYFLMQRLSDGNFLYAAVIMLFGSITWYLTAVQHVATLARRFVFKHLEI